MSRWRPIGALRILLMGACSMGVLAASGREAGAQRSLVTVSPIGFGDYDVYSSAPLDSTALIRFKCLIARTVKIEISKGGAGSYPRRLPRSGRCSSSSSARST